MGKRLTYTPKSVIRNCLRKLSLRSREHQNILKRDHYTCQVPGCGRKQSRAKGKEVYVQVHHIEGHDMEELIDAIAKSKLLNGPQVTQCKECHEKLKGKHE